MDSINGYGDGSGYGSGYGTVSTSLSGLVGEGN